MLDASRIPLIGLTCSCLLAGGPLHAQYTLAVGIAPEVSLYAVEHVKQVTIGGGSSTSASDASGLRLAGNVFAELRAAQAGGSREMSFELGVILPAGHLIEGTIAPTHSGQPHDVWPGRWEFRDRFGLGATLRAGWRVGGGGTRIHAALGTRAMWSEFATGGTNPETGIAGEDRSRLRRWPATVGAGVTLNSRWPLDLAVSYTRSSTSWVISLPDLGLDYDYVVSGLTFTVRVRIQR